MGKEQPWNKKKKLKPIKHWIDRYQPWILLERKKKININREVAAEVRYSDDYLDFASFFFVYKLKRKDKSESESNSVKSSGCKHSKCWFSRIHVYSGGKRGDDLLGAI